MRRLVGRKYDADYGIGAAEPVRRRDGRGGIFRIAWRNPPELRFEVVGALFFGVKVAVKKDTQGPHRERRMLSQVLDPGQWFRHSQSAAIRGGIIFLYTASALAMPDRG